MQVFLVLLLLPFAAPSVSEIPFSFENNKILIEVQETVSGETLRLFLDTGAPTILKRSATFAQAFAEVDGLLSYDVMRQLNWNALIQNCYKT